MTHHYAHTAYRSTMAKPLQGEPRAPGIGTLWRPLNHGVKDTLPYKFFVQLPPRIMRKAERKPFAPKWLLESERYGALNERCIRPPSLSKLGLVLENSQHIGRVFTYIFGAAGIGVFIMFILAIDFPTAIIAIPSILIFFCIPLFMWLISSLLYKFTPLTHGIGSPWEINRQTGLVSRFEYDKHNPTAEPQVISAPFAEMDGFIYLLADRYGQRFLLTLTHRYSPLEVKVGDLLGGAISRLDECDELWYFIQNYMDVSKPLPDIPLLEAYRSKDPTTAQYDQQTGRNPRYWIDMDNQAWAKQKQQFLDAEKTKA